MKHRVLFAPLLLAALLFAAPVQAADPVLGKALYLNGKNGSLACAVCHGSNPANGANNISKGSDWTEIKNAIQSNKGGMGLYSSVLTDTDLQNIAAFIADPASGTPSPKAVLAPTSLAYGSLLQGLTSAAKTATLSNSGTAALTIQNIVLGGANPSDFARSGSCVVNATLAAGASCTVDVTFTPLAVGSRSASISIAHNATGSPSALALSGNGVAVPPPTAPAVTLAPTSANFGAVVVGASSAPSSIQLTNSGTASLALTSIALAGTNAGDFARTTTCPVGGALAVGASCSISVTFAPTTSGARSAVLDVVSNASGAHSVALTGSGTTPNPAPTPGAAALNLSATTLDFDKRRIGETSRAKRVRVTNVGAAALTFSSISASGDYVQENSCGQPVNPGGYCVISVRFRPSAIGARAGDLLLTSNAPSSPHHVTLSGTGVNRRTSAGGGDDDDDDDDDDECEDDDDRTRCSALISPIGKNKRRHRRD